MPAFGLDRANDDSANGPLGSFVVPPEAAAAGEYPVPMGALPVGQETVPLRRRLIYRNLEEGFRQLPAYAQSLLRIRVPVTVTLATTKAPVGKILEMGPGTILRFEKGCDSNLTLQVGRQTVAEGTAVKVGDKFGLWITSITMPGERFRPVHKASTAKHAS